MNADGTGERMLKILANDPYLQTDFSTDVGDIGVDWSPDGKVVYGGQPEIFSIDADGGGERLLMDDGHSPSLAPDGRSVAYVRSGAEGSAIYVANADGTDERRITHLKVQGSGPDIYGIDWSPDSSWLVFAAERGCGRSDIYVVKPDGSDLARVTDSGWNVQPAWRPTSGAP